MCRRGAWQYLPFFRADFEPFPDANPLHLLSRNRHLTYDEAAGTDRSGEDRFMRVTQEISIVRPLLVCVAAVACLLGTLRAQQPPPTPPADSQPAQQSQQPESSSAPPPATAAQSSPSSSSSSSNKRGGSHANDFLIIGTVFTDKAYALPGARLRVRRTGEKKFRWDTYTNSRGEFALRVPQGGEYEILVIAKGFADQTNPVSAKSGISEDNVVYRMQTASGGKK
jgi:Carboxypeptidase regulatory-like domain